jgi:hypothetical protein
MRKKFKGLAILSLFAFNPIMRLSLNEVTASLNNSIELSKFFAINAV